MTRPRKPTIDERLEALTQSRERNAREALLSGIAAYVQALKADDNGQPE
jgi:hypothetical protein